LVDLHGALHVMVSQRACMLIYLHVLRQRRTGTSGLEPLHVRWFETHSTAVGCKVQPGTPQCSCSGIIQQVAYQ